MKEYLHKFENLEDFNASYFGNDYYEPWVSLTVGVNPNKVRLAVDNFEASDHVILTYRNEIVYVSGNEYFDGGDLYLWDVKDEDSGDTFAVFGSQNRTIKSGDQLILLSEEYGEWRYNGSYNVSEAEVIEDGQGKVNYNKIYDLVVDFAQGHDGSYYRHGCRIVSAADAIGLGTESIESSAYIYSLKSNSSINRYSTKKKIRVRLLNFFGKDVDLTATYHHNDEDQYISWIDESTLDNGWSFTLQTSWTYGDERAYVHMFQAA